MPRVLLIEDNTDIARLIALHVRDLGCEVDQAHTGEQGLALARGCRYDLVILDLMLPGMDGLAVCRHLRAGEGYVPILMLTAKSTELDRVLGLELGADDYLTKPFSIPELLARIKALFRRVDALRRAGDAVQEDDVFIQVGRMRIDPAKYRVTIDGREVSLTLKEFDLLLQFAANPGRVYTRAQLLDLIWGRGHQGYEHTVNSHINRLRAKIEQGRYDAKAMEGIFHAFMVVNPSIEVYLLDADGRILAYDAPPGRVKLERVDLAPVNRLIANTGTAPVTGPDPRDPRREKVFSAAPIGPVERPAGYLYVVLAGEQYDSVAAMFSTSFILRFATYGVVASLLLTLLVGLWLLHHLTYRLRRLDGAMTTFRDSGFERFVPPAGVDTGSGDEIHRLGRSFTEMAGRIQSQMAALRESDRMRRELLANVSHELRTPITSVKGYLETLLLKADRLSREEQREYLEIALRHSERLSRLVEELFELARLESGYNPLQRETFSLAELVQDVVAKNRIWADGRQVHLDAEIPPDLPFVEADIGLMERVLQNLIDNALRHTPGGGRVCVSLEARPGTVRVHVADTGEGIPPEELPYIFDRFYQAHHGEHGNECSGIRPGGSPLPGAFWSCIRGGLP